MGNEYVVGVKLQADASQYTAEFTRASATHQAFTQGVTSGATSASSALNEAAQGAQQMGAASQAAMQTASSSSKQAASAFDALVTSVTNTGTVAASTEAKLDGVSTSASRMGAATQAAMQTTSTASSQAAKSIDGISSAWYGVGAAAAKPQALGDVMQSWTRSGAAASSVIDTATGKTKELGISAAATAAAMRQVPAQFTDIVVSLQAGQSPMTVMLQQGGQLKDMFGGTGAAAKALGTYAMGLVGPFTVVAAAVAALGLAYNQGSQESDMYRESLVMSGNAAGTTTSQMKDMAKAVSSTIGTQSAAAGVLAEMARGGKVAGDNLQYFTEVALSLDKYAGQPIKSTVQDLEELGKKPVEASLKLNERYNYLTEAVYRQIKALQDQGQAEQAAALAQRTYADAMADRANELRSNLGSVERGWQSITGAAKRAWDAMLGIGRSASLSDVRSQIAEAEQKLNDLLVSDGFSGTGGGAATGGGGRGRAAAIAQVREQLGKLYAEAGPLEAADATEQIKAEQQARETSKVNARARIDELKKDVRDKAEIRKQAIEQLKRDRDELGMGQEEFDKLLAGINEKYKDPKSKAASTAGRITVSDADLANMRGQLEAAKEYGRQLMELGPQALQLNSAEREALKIGQQMKLATDAKTQARLGEKLAIAEALGLQTRTNEGLAASIQAHEKLIETTDADARSIEQRAKEQEAANSTLGKGRTAIQQMTLAELEKQMAEAQGSDRFDPKYIASLERKIEAQKKYTAALSEADGLAVNARADELLRNATELSRVYEDDLKTIGKTKEQREIIVAQRRIEIKYAKELADIDKSSASETDKAAARSKVYEAERREMGATTAQIIERQWTASSEEINRTLTDALMRGFESGKTFAQNLADTLMNMFNTMVLRPVISAIVQPVSILINGVVQTGLQAVGLGGGAGGVLNLASNAGSAYNAGSWIMGAFGGSAAGATGLGLTATAGAGTTLAVGGGGLGLSAGGGLGMTAGSAGAGTIGAGIGGSAGGAAAGGAAAGTGGLSGLLSSIPVWGWIAAAVIGAIGWIIGKDDSGTPHSGSVGSYSEKDGYRQVQNGKELGEHGIDMGMVYGGKDIAKVPETVSKGIVGVLDGLDKVFGGKGGYSVTTGFADDSSKDGAWGGLRIQDRDGKDLINWDDKRGKWAPREFSNGEDGLKEYLNAVAVDTRKVMMESMDLPEWAKEIVGAVDEKDFNLDALKLVVEQIGQVQTRLNMIGLNINGFADLTGNAKGKMMAAAGGIEALTAAASSFFNATYSPAERFQKATNNLSERFSTLGFQMPDTVEGLRKLVEEQMALGESGAENAAKLMMLTDSLVELEAAQEQLLQSVGITSANLSATIRDAMIGKIDGEAAGTQIADTIMLGVYNAVAGSAADQITQLMVNTLIAPVIQAALTGSSVSAVVSSAAIDNMVAQATAVASALSALFDSEEFRAAMEKIGVVVKDIVKSASNITSKPYTPPAPPAPPPPPKEKEKPANNYVSAADRVIDTTDKLADAYERLADSIMDEVRKIRGAAAGESAEGYAYAQAQFAMATAAARAGDQDAADKLPELSRRMLELAETNASTLAEFRRMQDQTAASLEQTAAVLAAKYGFKVPSYDVGTTFVPRDQLAMVHQGEAIIPRDLNPFTKGGFGGGSSSELEALMRDMVISIGRLEPLLANIERHTSDTLDGLARVTEFWQHVRTKIVESEVTP